MSEPTYHVDLLDRIRNLVPEWDRDLGPDMVLRYEFGHGYERVFVQRDGSGAWNYAGPYHPNIVCEPPGPGVCMWCGMTLW